MFRPSELSETGRTTEDTPVAGSEGAAHAMEAHTATRTARPPLSPRAQGRRNANRTIVGASAAILTAGGLVAAPGMVSRGPQSPSDSIKLTDSTLGDVYKCLREQFFLRSEQDLANSSNWLDEHCRNSRDPQTRDYMERVDGSDTPRETAVALRDAVFLQAGAAPGPDGGRPLIVRWESHPSCIRSGSCDMTTFELADPQAVQDAMAKGIIQIIYEEGDKE